MAVTANKVRPLRVQPGVFRPAPLAGALSIWIALLACPAAALEWDFTPTLGGSATFTDNVNQSANNAESSFILTATPGFRLQSRGSRRLQAGMFYGLTGVTRTGEGQDDSLYSSLNANANAELVEDFLFLDAHAGVSQQLISLLGSQADPSINDTNRAATGSYSISPYIKQRFGNFADAELRYSTTGAIFENDAAPNSNANAVTAGLSSGTDFNNLSWGINYSLRKAQNSGTADTTFERASATVGYELTRKFRVFGTVGQDWNDYLSTSKVDGSSWSAGFGWSPTRHTSFDASMGERYFGNTYSFSVSHLTRLSQWTARYSENVSDISQHLLEESSRTYWKCPVGGRNFYALVTDPNQPPASTCTGPHSPFELIGLATSPVEQAVLGQAMARFGDISIASANGVFIIKSFIAGVSWDLGKLGIGLSAHDTKRLYQALSDAQDHVQGVTGSVSYRLSHRTTASSSLSLTRNSIDALLAGGTAREDDLLSIHLGLNHRFADKLNGALTLRHIQRDSNDANSDYDENNITASFNLSF